MCLQNEENEIKLHIIVSNETERIIEVRENIVTLS